MRRLHLKVLFTAVVLLVSGCTFYSSDPDIASIERAAARAPKGPTPAIYMSPAEMYPDNPQAQALVKAACKGDVKEIDRLINAGADPNAVGTYGKTVAGWVLYHPNKAGFRRLLERGADPNQIWYDGDMLQSSLLHWAVERSDTIGTDYLKMCLEIGKGNPNLEPPDKRRRPIMVAVQYRNLQAFFMLYNAGAEISYVIGTRHGNKYLANVAASSSNFQTLLFLLHKGAPYSLSQDRGVDIHTSIQMSIDGGTISAKPEFPEYMWFWRCVKFLEQQGMTFHYGIYSPPAVLDTTPPDILGPEAKK